LQKSWRRAHQINERRPSSSNINMFWRVRMNENEKPKKWSLFCGCTSNPNNRMREGE
jgi:hypothetical protein